MAPNDITHARRMNKDDRNDLWEQSIRKEISNVIVAFELLEHDEPTPVGSKHITYHFIFDIKFDLTRKSRCVVEGQLTKKSAQCTSSITQYCSYSISTCFP